VKDPPVSSQTTVDAAPDDAAQAASRIGQRLGPYELVRHLGAGGMGNVFLARRADGQFDQEVAIKVMRRGVDTEAVLQRFYAERQILAGLRHPNICRLLDGGSSADGAPYLVMDRIDGEPLHDYCRWHDPPLARRLELFLAVCGAVRYAHQNLVVHCDLKPANILVTAAGTPMLLDFGIARLLAQPAQGTQAGFMTPAYASPEQVRGEPVTTATDVHALGILLYELLAGHNPFAPAGRPSADVARAIVDAMPPPPSEVAPSPRVARAVRGDLDTIVLRALAKEPERRYPSAGELAAEVERHIRREPVLARRDSVAYRAGRFVRRHRLGVAAAAAVLASLVAGIAATAWQAHAARTQRARAERRFDDVRRVANALVFDVHDAIADLPGSTPARKLLVERAATFLDGLAADAGDDITLLDDIADAYLRLGDAQGNTQRSNLGDFAGARRSYAKALATTDAVLARAPRDPRGRRAHAHARDGIAHAMWATGDFAGALAEYRGTLAESEAVVAGDPDDRDARLLVGAAHADIAAVLVDLDRAGDAMVSLRAALAAYRDLAADGVDDVKVRRSIPRLMINIGDLLIGGGEVHAALGEYVAALAVRELYLAREPDSAMARRDVSSGLTKLGNVLYRIDDARGALALYRRALATDRTLAAADPRDAQARRDVAVSLVKVGQALTEVAKLGSPEAGRAMWRDAAASFREALAIHRAMKAAGQLIARDEPILPQLEKIIATCDEQGR
jgi:non-specific serine/threonine protein kinase/serine/threonine-protein kinase